MNHKYPKPKKKLGQHFLISPYYAQRIASLVHASDDRNVVEIGPGLGALSRYLKIKFPRFQLIEKDKEVVPILKEKIGEGDWMLHIDNVLDFDFSQLGSPLHVVGNLPYNIAALIIKKTLLYSPHIASITFMVQREVAERIVAKPHTKQNSFLSIFCQFFGTPKLAFHVPPGAFYPKPNVSSSLFQLIPKSDDITRIPRGQWESFFNFVSKGFSKRRKTLINSLSWDTNAKALYADRVMKLGMSQNVRPEDLNIQRWLELFSSVEDAL